MYQNVVHRLRAGIVALALMGTTTLVGVAVLPAQAGADPVNLIQNGNFANTTTAVPTDGYLPVDAGDSTTISNWTVVTPSYDTAGGGSVDVVANGYNGWVNYDGNNVIDLAGTTDAPGGIYQDVPTTPGVQYTLTFYSAVNGDETVGDGVTHTLGVTVNGGSPVYTVNQQAQGPAPVWQLNTVTFTATSTTSQIEFDDDTNSATGPYDQNQGPTLTDVSLTAPNTASTTCTESGCSGTVSTPTQNVQIASTSTTGTIVTAINPLSTAPTCPGDVFRHAPQVTNVTDTGLNANIVFTVTFANKSAAGAWYVPFAICYTAQTPFKNLFGQTVTTGLLPLCSLNPAKVVAPCEQSIVWLPLPGFPGNVVEKVVVPPGDPRYK